MLFFYGDMVFLKREIFILKDLFQLAFVTWYLKILWRENGLLLMKRTPICTLEDIVFFNNFNKRQNNLCSNLNLLVRHCCYIVHNFKIKLNLISSLHLFSSGQGSNYIFSQDLITTTLVSRRNKAEIKWQVKIILWINQTHLLIQI